MATPFVAEIKMFAGNFAPRQYALCDGQLISISQNTALFSILGTNFGGDGRVTFALPDLRGRVPIQPGSGPGLSNYSIGQQSGVESVTLLQSGMPAHNHVAQCNTGKGNSSSPVGKVWAKDKSGLSVGYSTAASANLLGQQALAPAGGSQPHNNMQPFMTVNFIIALQGVFPPRS